jgi:PmbA protein
MLVERVIEKILKSSKYDTEVVLNEADRILCQFENGIVTISGNSSILGIRVTHKKKSGFATSSNPLDWEKTLDRATKIMKISEPLELEPTLPQKSKFTLIKHNKKLWKMDETEAILLFKDLCDVKFPIVSSVLEKKNVSFHFANSNGINEKYKRTHLSTHIEIKNDKRSIFDSHTDTILFDVKPISQNLVKICELPYDPVDLETGKMSVLMDYFAAASLIERVLVPSFLASVVHKNRSKLTGKIGEQMFSKGLTLTDDGTNYLNASPFDAEGTPRQTTELVKDGKLMGFLYDRYSAQKDKVQSTGNCASISARPSISPSNLIVGSGDGKFPDGEGYLRVHSLSGVHTSNPISGDFSVNANNATFVDVDSCKQIKHAMVSGNIFELFNKVAKIGNKHRQEGAVRTPKIMFEDVQVIG